MPPPGSRSCWWAPSHGHRTFDRPYAWLAFLAGLLLLLALAPMARAQQTPPGCTGSGLGINLFTSSPDVHIGDTIKYSVNVFNGIPGSPRIVCDAVDIVAGIVTPDGKTNLITLVRRTLRNGEADFYADVVSYVVRAQDIRPDGTVRATAFDDGIILQNDTPSRGGSDQGVNTEVSQPCIGINVTCLGTTGEAGRISFSGSVTNCGNNTLVGVTVTSLEDNGAFRLVFTNNIPRGAVVAFTGSFEPLNPCTSDTVTLTATGVDQFTSNPRTVTASASTTCATVLTPGILVTKVCPAGPVSPGQLLVYTGTVKNTGNVTLTNVTVTSDQPANTVVFTVATLAPGVTANYTGSYVAPVACATTSGVVARGTSICGVPVSSSASSTCAILTTPQLAVTTECAATVAAPGGVQTYTGTVRNTGDIALKNVVVKSDRPAANTTVFTVATLAPGAAANFTGTYTVPLLNACAVTTTVVATGQDTCTDLAVSATSAVTCGVTTTPLLALTLNCPAVPVATGAAITFTGTVSNPGNVTLNNVTVVNQQASPSTVFTVASLAPGASAGFTVSFTAPADACAVSTTVTASGSDSCTALAVAATKSATCALVTTPRLAITQECPEGAVLPGGVLTYSGTVRNTGDITVTNVVVRNSRGDTTPVLTLATLAPGGTATFAGSFTAPLDACSVSSTSTVSATSTCGLPVTASASSTCTILTTPLIAVTTVCSTNVVTPGGSVGYSGTVRNTGNVTLNNVTVVSDRPAANSTVFTVATLAPGASANFTGSYTAPASFPAGACGVTATLVATGRDLCTAVAVTATAAANCTVTTAPLLAVTLDCPAVPVATGALITFTGTVRNSGNVTLNNVSVVDSQASPSTLLTVPSLAPGASESFTASFMAPADACAVSATVTASGSDNCTSLVVTATKSATCTLLTAPRIVVTQECPPDPAGPGGLFSYSGTVRNAGNVTLKNVIVTDDRNGPGSGSTVLWVDDQVPGGAAQNASGGDSWNFITNSPAPFSGSRAHQSGISAGLHQHFFFAATNTLPVDAGDILVAHIYLDPANLPDEVMLQWYDGTWEHRAYWGANYIDYGKAGTASRRYMGPLPAAGQWVRLAVPASQVGLENRVLSGMAFTLFGGRATWDASGKGNGVANRTEVFTVASLAPGEIANFTGSYTLPTTSACSVTTTLVAAAADNCTGVNVTATTTSTCPLITAPAIEVTQSCPVVPVRPGGLLTYTGTVRNIGDITLTNVVVSNDRSGAAPILTLASLAPGASADFTGSYLVPLDCCTVSSTATATGADICTGRVVADTATRTCVMLTSPRIEVTKVCAPGDLRAGDRLTYTGTVRNTGDITLIDVEVVNDRPGSAPLLGRLTLAPGEFANYRASYIVPLDFCGTDTVTATGADVCTGALVTNSVTVTCPVITEPAISITKNCPTEATPHGGLFTYTGTVRNTGTVTLTDVIVVNSQPVAGTPVIGPLTLAPGASVDFSGSYIAPSDCCETTDTLLVCAVDRCTGALIKATATQVCPLLTTPRLALVQNCPARPVPVGDLFTFTGSVTNLGDVNLTNVMVFSVRTGGIRVKVLGPVELAPGEMVPFSGSYTVAVGSDPGTDILEATGMDTCLGRTVTVRANCSGPVVDPASRPVINSVTLASNVATVVWDSTAGVTYTLQCKSNVHDPIWIDIPGNVTATGASASKTDVIGPTKHRFYRVLVVE